MTPTNIYKIFLLEILENQNFFPEKQYKVDMSQIKNQFYKYHFQYLSLQ